MSVASPAGDGVTLCATSVIRSSMTSVVGPSVGIPHRVGQLVLDEVGPEAQHLVQNGPRHRPEPVQGHPVPRNVQRPERVPQGWRGSSAAPGGDSVRSGRRSGRVRSENEPREESRPPDAPGARRAACRSSSLRHRVAPLGPLALAQLAGPHEEQRCQTQGAPQRQGPPVAVQEPEQGADLLGIGDRGVMLLARSPGVARGCRRSGRAGRLPNPSPVRPPRTAAPSWLPPASTPGGACRLRGCGGSRWRGRERGPRPARALGASGAAKPRAIGNDRNQTAAGRTRTPQRSAGLPGGSKGAEPLASPCRGPAKRGPKG